jgi:hypothetical protein
MLSTPTMRRVWAVVALECALAAATGCSKSSTAQAPSSELNAPIPPPSNGDTLIPTDLYHLRSSVTSSCRPMARASPTR